MNTARFVHYIVDLPESDLHAGKTCVRIWDDVMKREIRLSDHMFENSVTDIKNCRKTTPVQKSGWTLGNIVNIQI